MPLSGQIELDTYSGYGEQWSRTYRDFTLYEDGSTGLFIHKWHADCLRMVKDSVA